MRQFVVGTGGAVLRSFGTVVPNSVVRWNGSHGVLELTLRPRKLPLAIRPGRRSDLPGRGLDPVPVIAADAIEISEAYPQTGVYAVGGEVC